MRTPVTVGVVGLRDWGRELARRFSELPQAEVRWLCDERVELRSRLHDSHRHARLAGDIEEILADEELDAVVLALPPTAQVDLIHRALMSDKHVLAQEPLAPHTDQAEALARLAHHRSRRLTTVNLLAFHPAVRKLKEFMETGRLGELYYVHVDCQYLEEERSEPNVLWGRAIEVVSLVLYLLGDEPVSAQAWAECYVQDGVADVAGCHLSFATGMSVALNLSWLNPRAVRRLTVVGSKRAVVFDALDPDRPLTIYEKGTTLPRGSVVDRSPRFGDIIYPRMPGDDPLRLVCEYFLTAVRSPGDPVEADRSSAVIHALELLERAFTTGLATSAQDSVGNVIRLPLSST